jgi:hypothetical protein
MSYYNLPSLASRHTGAGGGAVDNSPQGSSYIYPISAQSIGAICLVGECHLGQQLETPAQACQIQGCSLPQPRTPQMSFAFREALI